MNQKTFDAVLKRRIGLIKKVLGAKGKEYSSDTDRLANFKLAGASQEISPLKALQGMQAKHLVSIHELIKKHDRGVAPISTEVWDEKIGDAINYFILMEALIVDEKIEDGFLTETGTIEAGEMV